MPGRRHNAPNAAVRQQRAQQHGRNGGLGVLTSDTIDGTFSRLNVDDSLFTTHFDGAIKTTGSGTAAPIVAIRTRASTRTLR